MSNRQRFRIAGGDIVPVSRVRETRGVTHYVSFPPFPAVLMLPAAMPAAAANDVFPTVLLAALVLPLAFAALRRLVAAGLSTRSLATTCGWWPRWRSAPSSTSRRCRAGLVHRPRRRRAARARLRLGLGRTRHPILAGLALGSPP